MAGDNDPSPSGDSSASGPPYPPEVTGPSNESADYEPTSSFLAIDNGPAEPMGTPAEPAESPVESGSATLWQAVTKRWGLLVPVLVFIALILVGVFFYTTLIFSWDTAVAQRQITLFSDRFRPAVLHNNIYMNTPPVIAEDHAFFAGSIDAGQPPELVSMNLETGQLAWRLPLETDNPPLVAVPGLLYTAEPGGMRAQVVARSTVTGDEVWTNGLRLFGSSAVSYMARIDDMLSVRLADGLIDGYYLLDLESGGILQQKRTDTEFVFLIDRDPLRVLEALPGAVRATGRERWQAEVDGFDLRPFVSGNIILVQYRPHEAEHDALIAVSRQTGDVLWQRQDPVVGNTAVGGTNRNTAFTLIDRDEGTQLLALDLETGVMVGSVLFTPGEAPAAYPGFVAATADTVAVYFSDGRQFIVFDWLPPEEAQP